MKKVEIIFVILTLAIGISAISYSSNQTELHIALETIAKMKSEIEIKDSNFSELVQETTLEINRLNDKLDKLENELQKSEQELKYISETLRNKEERLYLSRDEIELFYSLVEAEAGICSLEEKQRVASVVINRVLSENFPNNLRDVIYQEGQFQVTWNGKLFQNEPTDKSRTAVHLALIQDNSLGSLYFANLDISNGDMKDWMLNNLQIMVQNENDYHTFLK